MTASRPVELGSDQERGLGKDFFNGVWKLLAVEERTDEQDDEVVHMAHASVLHWMRAGGTAAQRARGEWQCARVYSELGRPEPALHHARRCLAIVRGTPAEMEDFDEPAALEGLARAELCAGNVAEARRLRDEARAALARIADDEDREIIEKDIESIPLQD